MKLNRAPCFWQSLWCFLTRLMVGLFLIQLTACSTVLAPYSWPGSTDSNQRREGGRPYPPQSAFPPVYREQGATVYNEDASSHRVEHHSPPAVEYEPQNVPASTNDAKPVVVSLLAKAGRLKSSSDYEGASAAVERALRIDPRSPKAYKLLAEIRLDQKQYESAEQMAKKGLLYANADRGGQDLAIYNALWRIIAQARRSLGDEAGAVRAMNNLR